MNVKKKVYINTMGCQMNVYDAEKIERVLASSGYERTFSEKSADLIIANTCAIREKSQQKAISFLGRMAELKNKRPEVIIGIGGCVAQQEGEKIVKKLPHVDIVFGTDSIFRLPDMVNKVIASKGRVIDLEMSGDICEFKEHSAWKNGYEASKFVTIMQGCDNFCAYCVVPYVRGREKSRHPEKIIDEIQALADAGVKEVILLGQNVNSYGKKEGLCTFAELLRKVSKIEKIKRIRFTTSHPKDLSDDLINCFGNLDKLCDHIHLPVQSGSNAVLERMNRKYTREQYLEKINRLRDIRPGIAISSDIIVGFPGETEDDFIKTRELINTVMYDSVFAFKYSDRPNAPASAFSGKVSEEEKKIRLTELLNLQESITREKNNDDVGKVLEVLVEGRSKKNKIINSGTNNPDVQWTGRTSKNKIVNFVIPAKFINQGDDSFCGKLINVEIEKACAHSIWGKAVKY